MFANVKLMWKIGFGFGSVLVLLIVVSIISWRAIEKSSNGFTEYREMARDSNLTALLTNEMIMARMKVKDFIIRTSDTEVRAFQEYENNMLGFLDDAKQEINNPERAAKVNEIEREFNRYQSGFQDVVKYQAERDRILTEILNIKGKAMEQNLTKIIDSAHKDNDIVASSYGGKVMRNLLLARLYVVKFLDTNAQADIDRVNAEFSAMEAEMANLDAELDNQVRRSLLSKVTEDLEIYKENLKMIITAINNRNDVVQNTLDVIGPNIASPATSSC